ncbi:hypothetical protein GQX74_011210 [Glossina fuscipes]|nr:hypothetical protein GQX74_011210 [Glossina fuscipes]
MLKWSSQRRLSQNGDSTPIRIITNDNRYIVPRDAVDDEGAIKLLEAFKGVLDEALALNPLTPNIVELKNPPVQGTISLRLFVNEAVSAQLFSISFTRSSRNFCCTSRTLFTDLVSLSVSVSTAGKRIPSFKLNCSEELEENFLHFFLRLGGAIGPLDVIESVDRRFGVESSASKYSSELSESVSGLLILHLTISTNLVTV